MEFVVKRSNNRTKEEEKIILINDKDPVDLFKPFLKQNNIEMNMDEFKTYAKTMNVILGLLKNKFNRPRPYQLDDRVKVLKTDTHQTPSYPSGHAAYGYMAAELLSDKYPEYKKELFKIADQTGLARVIQGVHYTSDVIAAREFVSKLYKNIKSNLAKKS